jgi:hypothetical protein
MRLRIVPLLVATAGLTVLVTTGCGRDTNQLAPAPPNNDPIVFDDNFGNNATFQAFLGSKLDAVALETTEKYLGTASLKVTVPNLGNPDASFAGGAFTTNLARDLSGYNALTFWAKIGQQRSAHPALDVAGLGNDNTGTSKYEAKAVGLPLSTTWTKYVVPIPFAKRLTSEEGLFYFAEGPENGLGYDLYFDEVKFETVATITNPRPFMASKTVSTFVGTPVTIDSARVIFNVDGTDRTIAHSPAYFTFKSSNASVATVVDGVIQAVGGGTATITAKLDTVTVTGAITVNITAPPTQAAPTPTVPPANVISLFSNAYTNAPVDTWSTDWDYADVTDKQIAGNDVKLYTYRGFAAIEFVSHTIDATLMTHFHLDVWLPEGGELKVKLVDFGADGQYSGGDDREGELTFNATSTPPLVNGTWVGIEIPLADFAAIPPPASALTTRAHLAQLILSGAGLRTGYVDNVYFHK